MDIPSRGVVTGEDMTPIDHSGVYRMVAYIFVVSATFSIIIVSVGIFFNKNMMIAGFGVFLASAPFIYVAAVTLSLPSGIEVSREGIQGVFRLKRKYLVRWRDVVSLKSGKRGPHSYVLRFRKDCGRIAFWGLSDEPAEEVKEMWSRLFPDGRDIDEDVHSISSPG